MTSDERLYQIICSFPALKRKGVEQGEIPGITPTGFYAERLHDFLYHGGGGALSSGEFLLLEFLLNLYNPHEYERFNFGRAVNVWDDRHMAACLKAVAGIFNGQ